MIRSAIPVPVSGTALLLIDVINDLAFEGPARWSPRPSRWPSGWRRSSGAPAPRACPRSTSTTTSGSGAPTFARRWRTASRARRRGVRVAQRLRPDPRDYFVLKPKHSGFFDTTLDTLLGTLRIRRVILTGIAGNICVLFTANDAYMRDLKIFAPADCIVSNTAADNDHALRQIHTVLKGNLTESSRLAFLARDGASPPDADRSPGHENRTGEVLRLIEEIRWR